MILVRIEVFDWTSPDEQTQIAFHITEMHLAMSLGQLPFAEVTSTVDSAFVQQWLVKREPNMDYVRSLSTERCKEPVLGAYWYDDSVILIDGTHRYMARYLRGNYFIDYKLIAFNDWQRFADIKGKWPCS